MFFYIKCPTVLKPALYTVLTHTHKRAHTHTHTQIYNIYYIYYICIG